MNANNDQGVVAILAVDAHCVTGKIQVSIHNGSFGYRITGPKYNGRSQNLLEIKLTQRNADYLRRYLDAAFPQKDKQLIESLKAYIREHAALADKNSHEWSKYEADCKENTAYRAGMWYAYRDIERQLGPMLPSVEPT